MAAPSPTFHDRVTELSNSITESYSRLGPQQRAVADRALQSDISVYAPTGELSQDQLFAVLIAQRQNAFRDMRRHLFEQIASMKDTTLKKTLEESSEYAKLISAFADLNALLKQLTEATEFSKANFAEYNKREKACYDAYNALLAKCMKVNPGGGWKDWLPKVDLGLKLKCGGMDMPQKVFDWYKNTEDGQTDKTVFCQMPSLLQAGVAALAEEGASRFTPFGALGGIAAGVAANKLVAPDTNKPNSKIPEDLRLASGYSVKISAGDFVGVAKDTEKLSCNGKDAPSNIKEWYYNPLKDVRWKNKAVFCKTHAQSDTTDAYAVGGREGYKKRIRNGDFIGVAQEQDESSSGDEAEPGPQREPVANPVANPSDPVAEPAPVAEGEAEVDAEANQAGPDAEPAAAANPSLPREVTEATVDNSDSILQIIRKRFGDGVAKIGSAATYVTNLVRETLFDKLKANLVLAATGAVATVATASVGFALWYYGPMLLQVMGDPMAFLGWSFTSAQSAALNATQTVESALNASMDTMAGNSTDAQFAQFVGTLLQNATSAASNATDAATAAANATAQAAANIAANTTYNDFVANSVGGVNATEPVAAVADIAASITNATTPIATMAQTLRTDQAVYRAFVKQLAAKFAVQPAPLRAAITAITLASPKFNAEAILASAKAQAVESARALSEISIASFKQLQSMHRLLFPILESFQPLLAKSKSTALAVPTNVLNAFKGLGTALTVQNPASLQSFDTGVLQAMHEVQRTNGTTFVSLETEEQSKDDLERNATAVEQFPWNHENMNWGGGGPWPWRDFGAVRTNWTQPGNVSDTQVALMERQLSSISLSAWGMAGIGIVGAVKETAATLVKGALTTVFAGVGTILIGPLAFE